MFVSTDVCMVTYTHRLPHHEIHNKTKTNEVNLHRARLVLGWVTVSGLCSFGCRIFMNMHNSVCN